jgi:hypothetical protein
LHGSFRIQAKEAELRGKAASPHAGITIPVSQGDVFRAIRAVRTQGNEMIARPIFARHLAPANMTGPMIPFSDLQECVGLALGGSSFTSASAIGRSNMRLRVTLMLQAAARSIVFRIRRASLGLFLARVGSFFISSLLPSLQAFLSMSSITRARLLICSLKMFCTPLSTTLTHDWTNRIPLRLFIVKKTVFTPGMQTIKTLLHGIKFFWQLILLATAAAFHAFWHKWRHGLTPRRRAGLAPQLVTLVAPELQAITCAVAATKDTHRFLFPTLRTPFHNFPRLFHSSMMRRTSSATEIPRRLASWWSVSICGSVKEIICLYISRSPRWLCRIGDT